MRLWPENTHSLIDIFRGEYHVPGIKPKIIFDLGANLGYASVWFALKYPNATIYAFEPDPRTFKKLCRNTALFRRIIPLPYAVSDRNGTATFHTSQSSISSSLKQTPKTSGSVEVVTRTLSALIGELGAPDLIKFDIEGAEYDVFAKAAPNAVYVGEYHEDLCKRPLSDFLALFQRRSMTVRSLHRSRWLCTIV